jgi:hemerythrin-like metal-binding protein
MTIEWNDNLATGVSEIDAQHKELFKRINVLFEACSKRKGRAEVGNLLKFLEEYVVVHFGTEEKYMTMFNYPEYSSHKEEHTNFVNDSDLKVWSFLFIDRFFFFDRCICSLASLFSETLRYFGGSIC